MLTENRRKELDAQKISYNQKVQQEVEENLKRQFDRDNQSRALYETGDKIGENWAEQRARYAQLLQLDSVPNNWASDWTVLTSYIGLSDLDTGISSSRPPSWEPWQWVRYFRGFLHGARRVKIIYDRISGDL